jgi:SpoVK/Ycf46/Vps4 family AAA+-type ATPase
MRSPSDRGPYGSGRLAAASVLCADTETALLVIDTEQALRHWAGWEEIVDLSFSEAQLSGTAIYWSKRESLLARGETANRRQIEELRARIRQRGQVYSGLGFERRLSLGKGLIVLFSRSFGTGKTMTAELLAREQDVDMYKVDLASIVSKWVGETEKNLNQLFAEAEDANAIIFFDEADALFGERGEVKGAQDRWANLEVNFLLQPVEEYSGVVILATNLGQNIDEAFVRRVHVMVEFPSPDAEARFRTWRGMFPAGVLPPPDEDIRGLATQVKLPGGSIRNIVVDAAFRAPVVSSGECKIELRHLVLATAREYQKLGKPITKGGFGETSYPWVAEEIL